MLERLVSFLLWGEPGCVLADPVSVITGLSAAASLAGTVGSLFQKSPKEPKPIPPPDDAQRAQGAANEKRRLLAARGYKANNLSQWASAANDDLKQTFGG